MNIPNEVREAVSTREENQTREAFYEKIKEMVSCKQAVVRFIEGLEDEEMWKQLNTDDFKVLPVMTAGDKPTGYFAIFNIAEIDGREDIDRVIMEVPKGMEGKVIGANKWQVKEWVWKSPWLRRRHIKIIWVKGV